MKDKRLLDDDIMMVADGSNCGKKHILVTDYISELQAKIEYHEESLRCAGDIITEIREETPSQDDTYTAVDMLDVVQKVIEDRDKINSQLYEEIEYRESKWLEKIEYYQRRAAEAEARYEILFNKMAEIGAEIMSMKPMKPIEIKLKPIEIKTNGEDMK